MLSDFTSRIAPCFWTIGTTQDLLAALAQPDADVAAVVRAVAGNPYLEHCLFREAEALGAKSAGGGLHVAIGQLGLARARDLVCAIQLERSIGGRFPKRGKSGRWEVDVARGLAFARRAEAWQSKRDPMTADLAFAAGFLFDLMGAIAREKFAADAPFFGFAEQVFAHGLATAKCGRALAPRLGLRRYARQVFAACLVHDVGKLALALIEPGYVAFHAKATLEARPLPRFVRQFAETRRFAVGHETLGAHLVSQIKVLRSCETAVLHHHSPYLIHESDPANCSFAGLVAVASALARTPPQATKLSWESPELKRCGFQPEDVQSAFVAAQSE